MDRRIVYIGEIPQDTDILWSNKVAYIGLAKLSAAVLGTSTLLNNFTCVPTGPASMNVVVGAGEIYSLQNIDNTTYGSLIADTTHQIVKQGVNLDSTTLALTAPSTIGNSINYLIEIGFSELDSGSTVLPYYDSANPSVPFTGPNNNPIPQETFRSDSCTIQAKAGTSAPTGTQTTPSADSGFVGAFVVTIAHGATTIIAGNISTYASAPFITETLTQKLGIADLQSGAAIYAADTGTSNVYAAALTPSITAYTAGMKFNIKILNANSGASTLNINSVGAANIKYISGSAIRANDLLVGMIAEFCYDGTNFQLLNPATEDAGGILPISEGGTGVSSVTTSPTASSFAGWDANKNLSANSFINGYTTTATAAGTTTLTVSSTNIQFFTGSTTQTVVLPVTSTLVLGQSFLIENRSSGVITIQSSGANTIKAMEANSQLLVTCILTSGTSAASWDYSYSIAQGALPIADGGTSVTSVTTSPTASSFAGWDANSNLSANRFLEGYTTTATAAGTTTLTVSSTSLQYFTGSTTQTVKMPVTSTLVLGGKFTIQNRSSAVVTVQSSGSNTIIAMEANSQATLTCILTSGTSAASWDYSYSVVQGALPVADGGTGSASVVSAPAATAWAGWDANKNMSANNFIAGYTTTATAAGTTTLVVGSTNIQYFTGSTTQTVVLPVTSTLVLGQQFIIENRSSAVVTVQSSGANAIKAMEANSRLLVTCILTSGTTAASWDYSYLVVQGALPVADGGSGVATHTAYGTLCGGTTSTGAVQTVSPGSSGQVLVSGGSSALPAYTDYAAASTSWTPGYTGFSSNPTANATYQKIGKLCFIYYKATGNGTSNSANFTVTGLPFTLAGTAVTVTGQLATDNGSLTTCTVDVSGTTATLSKGAATGGGNWTASGNKSASFYFFYETST